MQDSGSAGATKPADSPSASGPRGLVLIDDSEEDFNGPRIDLQRSTLPSTKVWHVGVPIEQIRSLAAEPVEQFVQRLPGGSLNKYETRVMEIAICTEGKSILEALRDAVHTVESNEAVVLTLRSYPKLEEQEKHRKNRDSANRDAKITVFVNPVFNEVEAFAKMPEGTLALMSSSADGMSVVGDATLPEPRRRMVHELHKFIQIFNVASGAECNVANKGVAKAVDSTISFKTSDEDVAKLTELLARLRHDDVSSVEEIEDSEREKAESLARALIGTLSTYADAETSRKAGITDAEEMNKILSVCVQTQTMVRELHTRAQNAQNTAQETQMEVQEVVVKGPLQQSPSCQAILPTPMDVPFQAETRMGRPSSMTPTHGPLDRWLIRPTPGTDFQSTKKGQKRLSAEDSSSVDHPNSERHAPKRLLLPDEWQPSLAVSLVDNQE